MYGLQRPTKENIPTSAVETTLLPHNSNIPYTLNQE
jgi:hypothetical protein